MSRQRREQCLFKITINVNKIKEECLVIVEKNRNHILENRGRKGTKKVLLSLVLMMFLLFVSGCDTTTSGTLVCTVEKNNTTDNYKLNAIYTATYEKDAVTKVNALTTIISNDKELLTTFETNLKGTYEAMDEKYGGYTFDVTKTEEKVVANADIDYRILDLATLFEDEPSMKDYTNKNKQFTVTGMSRVYELQGATCVRKNK